MNSVILRTVRARKIAAMFLSLGYLAAVHCRVACAFSVPITAAIASDHDGCRGDDGEQGHHSKAPCCRQAGGSEALLPNAASALAPHLVLHLFAILPQTGVAMTSSKPLVSIQNHDPPPSFSQVLSLSSLSPRAPPAVLS